MMYWGTGRFSGMTRCHGWLVGWLVACLLAYFISQLINLLFWGSKLKNDCATKLLCSRSEHTEYKNLYTQIYHQIVAQCFILIIQNSCMFRPYILAIFRELLQPPEDGQDIWPQHVALYNEYKTLCSLLVVNLCVLNCCTEHVQHQIYQNPPLAVAVMVSGWRKFYLLCCSVV